MKTLKTLFALSLTLCALMPLKAVHAQPPPRPDMTITKVNEKKKTATVYLMNNGNAPTGNFILRVYAMTPNGWQPIAQVIVESITPCCPRIVTIEAGGIEGDPTLYVVDPDNRVPESNETNNQYIHRKAGR